MSLPSPLAWVQSYAQSVQRALGCDIRLEVKPTVNQLVYKTTIYFGEPQSKEQRLRVWNMLQTWAAKNDAMTGAKVTSTDLLMRTSIGMKQRLGPTKDTNPWA